MLNFLCRLLHNYKISGDSFLPGKKIFDDYVDNCTEKENYLLQEIEVGRILKEVFPEIRRVQRRVKGVRTWTYTLSKIQTVEKNENTCSIPTTDSSSQAADAITWENLPIVISEFGWQLVCTTDDFHEWIKLGSQDLCDGNRVLYEVKILKNWDFTVHVNNKKVSRETLGIQNLNPCQQLIRYLFDILNKCTLCKGFQVPSKRITKDVCGNMTGRTEEWCSREDDTVVLQHRSTKCSVLLPNDFKRTTRRYCENCVKLKKSCNTNLVPEVDMEKSQPSAKKRDSYMSENELREKLNHERTRRINAERRENYLRDKINQEMKNFDEEDHKDFSYMFQRINKGSVSEDMKIFWEEQEKALHAKSPRGYRWHPKYV